MGGTRRAINLWAGRLPVAMSLLAIVLVTFALATGWGRGPAGGEGAAAHLWQLLIGLQVPAIVTSLATADWRRPFGIAAILGLQILGLVLALAPVAILGL